MVVSTVGLSPCEQQPNQSVHRTVHIWRQFCRRRYQMNGRCSQYLQNYFYEVCTYIRPVFVPWNSSHSRMANSCPCWQQLRFGSKGWHPSIADTIGNQQFCIPNSAASGEFLVGMVLGNWAVEHNMAFPCRTLAGKAKPALLLWITALICCQVVNSSRDGGQCYWKVDDCSLNH